ncbi:1-phosphofructokinase family hexose kinase [Rhizobium sp. FY34]|uniref:1-phosphofructokinase family hexose kinase n=1 Tax=Rhizobium sp. FY34 TaxID=2562309 RepID=UPI0010BF7297|nr:1-phosphofructokinase family hexose kinase [Rhizobium sp. FY34]
MTPILCITLNPTLDLSNDVDRVMPTHKMRVRNQRQDVGGGGINVARVITELGGQAEALVLSGGASGILLEESLNRLAVGLHLFPIGGSVRIAFMVHEDTTNLEYRFVPEGPLVSEAEVAPIFDFLRTHRADYVVASGSLPRGVAADTYARMAKLTTDAGARFVLDASGEPLAAALAEGGIFLFKPSLSELERLVGHSLDNETAAKVCADLVARGAARHVALTLGEDGAMLVGPDGALPLPAIKVPVRSAVGAGDSFVGAMVWALSQGQEMAEAFRFGLAAGAAAVMTPGTELCRKEDILTLYAQACALRHEEKAGAWLQVAQR